MNPATTSSDTLSPRRRASVLLVWLALVLLAVWQITRTSFVADLSAFLPASPDAQQRVLIDQLQRCAAPLGRAHTCNKHAHLVPQCGWRRFLGTRSPQRIRAAGKFLCSACTSD